MSDPTPAAPTSTMSLPDSDDMDIEMPTTPATTVDAVAASVAVATLPTTTAATDAAPAIRPPSVECVQCSVAESAHWQTADDGGQICFNCFELMVMTTTSDEQQPPPPSTSKAATPPVAHDDGATANRQLVDLQPTPLPMDDSEAETKDAAAETASSSKTTTAKTAVPHKKPPTSSDKAAAAAAAAIILSLNADHVDDDADLSLVLASSRPTSPGPRGASDEQRRLRKSTRSTRYKANAVTPKTVDAANSAGRRSSSINSNNATGFPATASSSAAAEAAAEATFWSNAAAQSMDANEADDITTNSVSTATTAVASAGNSIESQPTGVAATTSTTSKATAPRGRSRRGALFKKHPPQRTPTVTATTRCVPNVFHGGTYMQVGDIVSLVAASPSTTCDGADDADDGSADGDVFYAQIRGLLVDSFCEKSAFLTWLLPTLASPPPNERFEASTYVIGPDEDFPRRLDCMEFVMHAPSGYYHSPAEPYPAPDGQPAAGDGPMAGFIWTSLAETTMKRTTTRTTANRERTKGVVTTTTSKATPAVAGSRRQLK